MLDVKKLITGFLILAAGASASAFILSSATNGNGSVNTAAQTAAITQQQNPVTGNAFVGDNNAQAANIAADPTQVSTTTAAQLNDPNNLTNNLADAFVNNFAAANPDSNQTVTAPDNEAIINQLAAAPAAANIKFPNWDIEAAEYAGQLTVINDASPSANAAYASGLKNIFDQYFVRPNLSGMIQNASSDPSIAPMVAGNIESALKATLALPTPTAMLSLQKSIVKVYVYEKNFLALVKTAPNDAVKNMLIMQGEERQYNNAVQELQSAMQKASALGINFSNGHDNNPFAFINNLLGIKTAHAIFGLGDITFDPSVFGQLIVKYAKDIGLQILKNSIMALIQQKILSWVQGSGAPRFIQNWGNTIVNSYANAAMNALNSQFSCIPQAMLPSLKVLLTTPTIAAGGNNTCSGQFQSQLGNNLTNFYNHFSNGGLSSYFSLFQNNGNAWGAIITIQDNVAAAAATNQQATLAKAGAAQGYKGSEVCADGSNPNGAFCIKPNGSRYNATRKGLGYSCQSTADTLVANAGLCTTPDANGSYEPQVTTPGNVTNQAFGVALDASPKLIAAATDIAGLLNAFLSSVLNTLAQSAINYSQSVINGIGQGGSGPSDGGAVQAVLTPPPPPTSTQLGVSCVPKTQNAIISINSQQVSVQFYAQDGATDANGNPPTYSWSAPGAISSSGGTQVGDPSIATYPATPQIYSVTVTASTNGTTDDCQVQVQ